MDHDYELEDDYAPRVLWGRLVFFAVLLLLAFIVGRCSAPDGVSQDELTAVQAENEQLRDQNEVLQAQLDAADGEDTGEDGDGNADEEPTEDPETANGDDGEVGEGETYTVQPGDTLTRIADQFYGDPRKFDLIVDANNLSGDTPLRVGQELIIPPDPDA